MRGQVRVPVVLLRVVQHQAFQRVRVGAVVADAPCRIGQAQQVVFARAAAGLLGGVHLGLRILEDLRVVAALRLHVGDQLVERRAVAAGRTRPIGPLGGLGPVLLLRVGKGQRLGDLRLLGARESPRGHRRLEGGDRGAVVAGALGGGALHAVDHQLLGGILAAHRVGLARLGQRLAGLAGLEQVAGLLQRLADLGADALGQGGAHQASSQQGSGQDADRFHGRSFRRRRGRMRYGDRPLAGNDPRMAAVDAGVLPGRRQFMNCSLPTMPILVTPRRCALAITMATYL